MLVKAANRLQSASIFFDPEPEEEIGRFVATARRLLIIAFRATAVAIANWATTASLRGMTDAISCQGKPKQGSRRYHFKGSGFRDTRNLQVDIIRPPIAPGQTEGRLKCAILSHASGKGYICT
jgi:hypothetical protein